MIETITEIRGAAESWWRFWLWLPRWRRVIQEMVAMLEECGDWRSIRMEQDAHICILEHELKHEREKVAALEFKVGEKDDALAHVGRFIAASHRISGRAAPGTIKELLQNAQRTN